MTFENILVKSQKELKRTLKKSSRNSATPLYPVRDSSMRRALCLCS